MIQLQDTDAGAEVIHLAENGFCADGEQEALVADGALEIGGTLPVNTDGGSDRERRADRRVGPAAGARGRAAAPRAGPASGRFRAIRRSATRSSTALPAPPACRSCRSEVLRSGHAGHARAGRAPALGPPARARAGARDRRRPRRRRRARKRLAAAVRDAGWLELRDDAGATARRSRAASRPRSSPTRSAVRWPTSRSPGPCSRGDLARRAGRGRRRRCASSRSRRRSSTSRSCPAR